MGCPTRPSNVRVCQFRHFRKDALLQYAGRTPLFPILRRLGEVVGRNTDLSTR
jgi:hypothetical protein